MLDQAILIDVLLDALRFYADPANWEAKAVDVSDDERMVFVFADGREVESQTWESGPALDGGDRARVALELAGLQ